MNVQILESGKEDLRDGRLFYERQGGRWLGSYFFDTLFSAMDNRRDPEWILRHLQAMRG